MKIILFLLALIGLFQLQCQAQSNFPDRTIMLIVPFGAGSANDIIARSLKPALEKELGVGIVVKNISGAGGTLGAAEVSKANPDGHTLGMLSAGPMVLQPQIRNLPYTTASFKPVACVYDTPFVVMVRSDSPLNSLADLKKFLLEQDGQATFGSPGPGGMSHLAAVALLNALGAKAKHIPELSSPEIMKNMAGGVTHFYVDQTTFVATYGVKPLAILADQREPTLPNVPTMKELGYNLKFSQWGGIVAPTGTPDTVINKLEPAVRSAVNSPEFKARAQKSSFVIRDMSSVDFGAFIDKQLVITDALIDKLGIMKE